MATFTVTNLNDNENDFGSLRFAIKQANAQAGADTIIFDPILFAVPRTIGLSTQLLVNDSLTIKGPGVNNLTISGDANKNGNNDNGDVRLLFVNQGTVQFIDTQAGWSRWDSADRADFGVIQSLTLATVVKHRLFSRSRLITPNLLTTFLRILLAPFAGNAGYDLLTGGGGEDRFLFKSIGVFNADDFGSDRITDFTTGTDKILLSQTTFGTITSAQIAFVDSDLAAETSNGLIVCSRATRHLFFNQNGAQVGLGTGALFATLDGTSLLTISDFQIIA